MKNMKVSMKLIVSFLIVIILAAAVGVIGILGMKFINDADDELYNTNLLAINAMADFREAYQQERTQLRAMILATYDTSAVQAAISEIGVLEKTISNAMAAYEATITDESEETGYFSAKAAYLGDYATAKNGMYEAALAGDQELAYQRLKDAGPVVAPIVTGLTEGAKLNSDWAKEAVNANTDLFNRMTFIEIAILVVTVAVAMTLALYISSLISKPLAVLTGFMDKAGSTGDITLRPEDIESIGKFAGNRDETGRCIASTANFIKHVSAIADELGMVANGDLTPPIEVLSEKDVMGVAMQKTVDSLNSMFAEIYASTGQVSTGSKQIADGAQSLAQGSTEQASAVQQLSASISEISEKTKENAGIAREAASLSGTIKGSAEKGSVQMDQMMQAVREINEASNQISKVIKVIDDIAFQTNILALNAAVEAARAGQHGKGFAVVAEEVRSLAAKSAEAAKDTGGLIENSIERANHGLNIATETSESLKEIVEGINRSAVIVSQIALSSDEQAAAITQINTGVDQVAQVVQQNSATAEESAAASQEMSGQADMLEQLISQFKLKDSEMNRFQSLPSAGRGHRQMPSAGRPSYSPAESADDFGKY